MQVRAGKDFGTCGCGRSPTGDCIGWHAVSEDKYKELLAEYNARQDTLGAVSESLKNDRTK
jgi:hypothetical protein